MKINSDINILGGLPSFELIKNYLSDNNSEDNSSSPTKIKTEKSVKRFEKAIKSTLLTFANKNQRDIVKTLLLNEEITNDSRLILFWNASFNNELLNCINLNIFFPAYYSGRVILKQTEVAAYLNDLRSTEQALQKWAKSTLDVTASKYLTLLKKFDLLEGSANKKIKHPFLNDKMFICFVYWLVSVEKKTNILKSNWLRYSFFETKFFIERALEKKFSNFFEVNYSGDKLQIRPLIEYQSIYDSITQF